MNLTAAQGLDLLGLLSIAGAIHFLVGGTLLAVVGAWLDVNRSDEG